MPPVRWKVLYVTTVLVQIWMLATAQSNMQNPITMTSDGWRPIVGNRRQPPGLETDYRIHQYKPPSQKATEVEIVKSENPMTITSTTESIDETESSTKAYHNINAGPSQLQNKGKVPPHSKMNFSKYQTIPPSAVTIGRPSQFGFRKHPLKPVKPVGHLIAAPKRKIVRGQLASHSTRNEVYVQPIGAINYPFIKQLPSNIRSRETQGLDFFGSPTHFTVNQPNAHIEINRFPSENVFEQYKSPGLTYIIPKLKNNQPPDEYSRNLVPPPPLRNLAEKEKLKNAKIPTKFKENVAPVSEPIIEFHQQYGVKTPQIDENLVHGPINFDQNFILQKQIKTKQPAAVDVQVTKENLKVYHNILPNRYKTNGPEYVDYDYYHSVVNPVQLPKLQTYEVTEGKWADNPNPYTFNYVKPQEQSQNIRHQQPIGPPATNPQITNEPIVELNLPPFLPTPFRPDPAIPTSPTQSEVSTVFSQVSKKMNKYKNSVLANNPLFFDIKEVSTHYPILGKPEFILEGVSERPTKENEISNEVTTQSPELTTKKRRRRPQPRRPPATTTTEEPQPTEIYESQKSQEETTPETEKPPKRQRQRPNRYKFSTVSTTTTDYQDRYRTTTPSSDVVEDSGEKRIRGRNRYRQRGNQVQSENRNTEQISSKTKDPVEHRNSVHRKRTRPTTTEMPYNHKLSEKDNAEQAENTEFESKYFQNTEEVTVRPQRIVEYEDGSLSISDEDRGEINYESTPAINSIEDVMVKLHVGGRENFAITNAPEETTLVNDHKLDDDPPATTVTSGTEIDQGELTQLTLATTIPTTTSTEARTTTTKSKIKTRPTLFKSNRPRFSVKDYRQRLNQFTTSTAVPTTDIVKTTSEGSRFRFPSRLRTRPTSSTTTFPQVEETTTELIQRRRFKPKDPRHTPTTESTNIIPETNVKSVNTRLRPFDRHKSTTESSAKAKSSIKPKFYLNRRRPAIAIKTKLVEKENQTEDVTLSGPETDDKEKQDEIEEKEVEVTTVYQSNKIITTTTDIPPLTTIDISDDDYSQRISDLTSSFKSEYETPGLFKSVAPISRRVPNYFTISTDDPILPIEAFFPGIKEKEAK